MGAYLRLAGDLEDSVTLIELGEAEDDDATVAEGEAQLRKLEEEAQRRSVEALLALKRASDLSDAMPLQAAMAEFVADGGMIAGYPSPGTDG